MKKLLPYLCLFTVIFVKAQNDDCSGATQINVGTNFASGAITSNNIDADTDGNLPSCNDNAVENIWFKAVVPASGNLTIESRSALYSLFDDTVLTVYNGDCNSLSEIACDDDSGEGYFSKIKLTGQIPGTTLYISVWKYNESTENGKFLISAYDVPPPSNDDCTSATSLTVGTNFNSYPITSSNSGATTDGTLSSCNADSLENTWFKVVVPASGNITLEVQEALGSSFISPVISVYTGSCGALTEIACDINSSPDYSPLVSLTGQTPGNTLYISVWKYSSSMEDGEFKISAYDSTVLSAHEALNNKKDITVSPNPFSDVLNIPDISKIKSASIIDPLGKLIKTIEKPSSQLYLNYLESGSYLVILKMTDGTAKTIKVIKK